MAKTALDNAELAGALAQTYARAVFELADEAGALEIVGAELADLVQLLDRQDDLRILFEHMTIPPARRAQSIQHIFGGRVHDLTFRFLMILNDHHRLGQLPGIRIAFDQMLKDQRGEVDVDVYSARELTAGQLDGIGRRITAAIGRTAMLRPFVDSSLIGGLKIRIADRLIDGSVATQLQRLKRQIVESGFENVRTGASAAEGPKT